MWEVSFSAFILLFTIEVWILVICVMHCQTKLACLPRFNVTSNLGDWTVRRQDGDLLELARGQQEALVTHLDWTSFPDQEETQG